MLNEQSKTKKLRSGIYKWTNKTNGKVYIGQAEHILKRKKRHLNLYKHYFRQKKRGFKVKTGKDLYLAMIDEGWKNFKFEIVEYCELDLLNEREEYWIEYYKQRGEMYNMLAGFRTDKKYKE